jgi:hypothetical protein
MVNPFNPIMKDLEDTYIKHTVGFNMLCTGPLPGGFVRSYLNQVRASQGGPSKGK